MTQYVDCRIRIRLRRINFRCIKMPDKQKQRTLTYNFSKQQGKHFLACRERQNGLFRASVNFYASKMTTFDAPLGASSQRSMNGYVSKSNVFSFCEKTALVEKNSSMSLGKFMWQNQFTVT